MYASVYLVQVNVEIIGYSKSRDCWAQPSVVCCQTCTVKSSIFTDRKYFNIATVIIRLRQRAKNDQWRIMATAQTHPLAPHKLT